MKQTRSQKIALELRQKILSGELKAKQRLQEVQIAEQMDASRTPVREALRSLAEEGLLNYEANRGFEVREYPLSDILLAFRVRGAMEGLGVRLITERGLSEDEIKRLKDLLAEGDGLLSSGAYQYDESQAWRDFNRRFHIYFLKLANSELLAKVAKDAQSIPVVNAGAFPWYEEKDFARSHEFHHLIVEAMIEGRADRAETLMREHIEQAGRIIGKALKAE